MTHERVTVSLDEDARSALSSVTDRTGEGRSEAVRRALTFYAANFEAATADAGANLEEYHQMLSGGEHVLLDVDFLHCFLEHADFEDEDFRDALDAVGEYHAREYADRFEDAGELLDWLSFCGFLSVRDAGEDAYHVVFPSEATRRFMMRFVRQSTADLPFELAVEESLSKALITERAPDE